MDTLPEPRKFIYRKPQTRRGCYRLCPLGPDAVMDKIKLSQLPVAFERPRYRSCPRVPDVIYVKIASSAPCSV